MKIFLRILIWVAALALTWIYLTLYMLMIACISIVDKKISYRCLPYIFLPLLFGFGVLYLLEKVKKKYDFNRKIKINLLIIVAFAIPLIFFSIKSPSQKNYAHKPKKNADESYNEFQKLSKRKLDCSFTNIPFSDFKSNTLAYADVMEAAWTNNYAARNIINKLNSFDKIFSFFAEEDGNEKELFYLMAVSKLYSRYAMLKVTQNEYKIAAKTLLSMNSLFRKFSPYAANNMRLVWCIVDNRTIKAMEFLTESKNCPPEIMTEIQKSLFKIKPDIQSWYDNENILFKEKLDEYILIMQNIYDSPMNFSLKVSTYLLTDKNKSYKDEKIALNVLFNSLTNQPIDFSGYNKYMKKYKSSIPSDNVIGWEIINIYNSTLPETYETIIKQIKKRNKIVEKIKNH